MVATLKIKSLYRRVPFNPFRCDIEAGANTTVWGHKLLTCYGLPHWASVWTFCDSSRCGGQETGDVHMGMCRGQEGARPVRGLVVKEWGVTVLGGWAYACRAVSGGGHRGGVASRWCRSG